MLVSRKLQEHYKSQADSFQSSNYTSIYDPVGNVMHTCYYP